MKVKKKKSNRNFPKVQDFIKLNFTSIFTVKVKQRTVGFLVVTRATRMNPQYLTKNRKNGSPFNFFSEKPKRIIGLVFYKIYIY